MRRLLPALFVASLAALVSASLPPAPARAGSAETDAITVGSLAERAELVAVIRIVGPDATPGAGADAWRAAVEERLRGPAADAEIVVRVAAGRAPVARGGRFLAFLRRADDAWTPESLPWGFRLVAEDGVPALVDYARGYAACLDDVGRVAAHDALAEHLVSGLGSASGGVPFCAGRDLLRHDELHPLVTPRQRDRVTDALRTSRKPDADFASIVLAAGACGGPGTDDLLVERLLDASLRSQRRNVVAALRRRATPALAKLLSSKVGSADAVQRADLANALGRLDLADAAPALLGLVRDDDRTVRIEAAHGLGLLARAIRAPRAGDDPEAARPRLDAALAPLVALAESAPTENERRAALWAVAQIDVQDAWAALRRIAKEHAAPRVRELAQRFLEQPRTSLLLDGA